MENYQAQTAFRNDITNSVVFDNINNKRVNKWIKQGRPIGKHKGEYFVVDTNVGKNNLSLPEYGLLAIDKSATKRYENYKFNKNK